MALFSFRELMQTLEAKETKVVIQSIRNMRSIDKNQPENSAWAKASNVLEGTWSKGLRSLLPTLIKDIPSGCCVLCTTSKPWIADSLMKEGKAE